MGILFGCLVIMVCIQFVFWDTSPSFHELFLDQQAYHQRKAHLKYPY